MRTGTGTGSGTHTGTHTGTYTGKHTGTYIERTGPASVRRLVTVTPGTCGSLKALAACAGDWTWETVGAVCGLDVFSARDEQGTPSYLAFYYARMLACGLQPRQLTFGDRLEVCSRVFDAGPLSVLTVHRMRRVTAPPEDPGAGEPFDAAEAFVNPRPDCLYVENLNVWLSRSAGGGNVGLVRSPPVGFTAALLPKVPPAHSPRALCGAARYARVLPDPARDGWVRVCPDLVVDHAVDLIDDVNGVGLLYFASFFSIAERAQVSRWRSLGRSGRSFLDRRVEDFRICYLGNADLDATLSLRLRTSRHPHDPAQEKSDLVVRDASTDRTVAVASSRYRRPPHG
ncbi:LnmK family bifunctional acyltransferase/decarboxylase [Streptomyces sp. NPDC051567]|uniref:LnmK family bifunctional acyltransferase/decarboxylase n=1 Tax=Streptomyces sp. NPDC051567 TaxID=3365660 RepID=UPI00379B2247